MISEGEGNRFRLFFWQLTKKCLKGMQNDSSSK